MFLFVVFLWVCGGYRDAPEEAHRIVCSLVLPLAAQILALPRGDAKSESAVVTPEASAQQDPKGGKEAVVEGAVSERGTLPSVAAIDARWLSAERETQLLDDTSLAQVGGSFNDAR